jgi:hypothetical protein
LHNTASRATGDSVPSHGGHTQRRLSSPMWPTHEDQGAHSEERAVYCGTGVFLNLDLELPGFLNWALESWDRYARARFVQPPSAEALVQEFEDLGSPTAPSSGNDATSARATTCPKTLPLPGVEDLVRGGERPRAAWHRAHLWPESLRRPAGPRRKPAAGSRRAGPVLRGGSACGTVTREN